MGSCTWRQKEKKKKEETSKKRTTGYWLVNYHAEIEEDLDDGDDAAGE